MKRFIKLFVLFLLIGLSASAQRIRLLNGNTNLRFGPSMRAAILSDYNGRHIHYSRGTTFDYAGETRNGFHSIYVNGDILWVSTQFSEFAGSGYRPHRPEPSYNSGEIVINGTNVNFRLSPSLNAPILSDRYGYHIHVPKYTRLPFIARVGSFYKTRYNGRVVYVHSQYAYLE